MAGGYGWNGDLLQGFPLRFRIVPGIVVGRVEVDMTEPTADDRNVNAGRDEVHGGGVPEGVWRYVLGPQRWRGFGRRLYVGGELEADPRDSIPLGAKFVLGKCRRWVNVVSDDC